MALPLVAIVGRPNVGKSTLINRIIGSEDAIVSSMRGVTRDRSYHEALWSGVRFKVIDTGGIEITSDDSFQSSIRAQALLAAEEADVVVFVVDSRSGIAADDEEIARILRKRADKVLLAVNKLDTPNRFDDMYDFYRLGFGDVFPVSAIHGLGTGDLLDCVVEHIASLENVPDEEDEESINVAIIGRPNAGKSSLVNQMTGTDRSIVSDVAGTTRDAVDTLVRHNDTLYNIVDTAGLRRKAKIDEDVEYYGFVRAMRAIDRAEVALLVIDGSVGLTDQDQRVARFAHDRGCALVIVLNKWDIVEGSDEKLAIREKVADRLMYVRYAQVVAISALSGKNVKKIWDLIDLSYENFQKTIPTNQLNNWLASVREKGHTVSQGKTQLRIKYVTQTGTCPPVFTLFANRPDIVDDNYERYLEKSMRTHFDLRGTPLVLKFKKKD